MSNKLKILLAPIGYPKNYKEVEYSLEKCNKKLFSKVSFKLIKDCIQPNECYIFIADTLGMDTNIFNKNFPHQYQNIQNYAVGMVKSLADNCKIITLSGTGSFKVNEYIFEFKAKATDYYYHLLYKLIKEVFSPEKLKNINELEIHLDITHGINFMPAFMYKAVKEIAEILAMFIKNVRFFVYNSDPYTQGLTKKLNINLIEKSIIKGKPYDKVINKNQYKLVLYKDGKKNKNIKGISYPIFEFMGSIYNSLPLAVYKFFPNIEFVNIYIDKALEFYLNNIKISISSNKAVIDKEVYFTNSFKAMLFLYLTASLLKEKNIVSNYKEIVELNELIYLNKNFFSRFDNKASIIIGKEIGHIKEITSKFSHRWRVLSYLKFNNDCCQLIQPSDKRNFFAHAGLEYSLVEIRKFGEKLQLRYRKNVENIHEINKEYYCNIQISSKKLKCDDKKRDINILKFEDTLKIYIKEGLTNEDE